MSGQVSDEISRTSQILILMAIAGMVIMILCLLLKLPFVGTGVMKLLEEFSNID